MPGTMRVLVAGICAVLLSCRPALLLPRLAELSFHPPELSRPAGGTATFFCNISTVNFTHFDYSLNWYRVVADSNESRKIAEFNGNSQNINGEKFQLIKHNSIVEMRILKLQKNDTGAYYCGLIAFSSPSKLMESNKSRLTVTEERRTTSIPGPSEEDEEAGDFKVPLIIILSVAGAVLLALFAYMLFIVTRRPAGLPKPQSENAPLEEKFPTVTVYTVDYGVLEFQQDEKTKTPEESFPADQTEYATIVFSEETPVTPEKGKKTKNQRACQTRMQP